MVDNTYQTMLNRLIEEKHTFTYKKLVVPMSMRSPYWKYFGFPANDDGSILTKVKIICVLCKAQIAYNKNTSNLRMHLQNRHPNELTELVAVHPPESRPSVKAFVNDDADRQRNYTSGQYDTSYRPSVQRQSQFPVGSIVLKGASSSPEDSKAPRKRKFHRMLETTNSGFIKQGAVYATPLDGSIEIEGDLQFISDPNINISSFAEEEYDNSVSSIQILGSSANNSSSNVVLVENNSNNQTEMSSVESKSVCDAITDMIVADLISPDIVEKRGFQRLVATLRSPCEIPSTARIVDDILPTLYSHVKQAQQTALLNQHGNVGLSLEEWTSREGETMVTISVQYLHKCNTKVESRVLGTLHSPYDPTHNWASELDSLLSDWQIDSSRVTAAIVATDQQDLLDALRDRGIVVVPCLLHAIQEAARSCFDMPETAHLLGKVRSLLSAIQRDADVLATLRVQENVIQVEEPLALDYPPVWMTTYYMMEQTQMRRQLIPAVLENCDEQMREFMLTDEEWDTLDELLTVLEPLRVAVLTLGEERVPLLSLLEPLLWQLVDSHLQIKADDSEYVQVLKRKLVDHLSSRYSEYNSRILLRTTTQLDPRFKLLPHTDESMKSIVIEQLHKAMESTIEEDSATKKTVTTPSKKNRLSGLLGNLCPNKTSTERAKNELDQFNSVASAALDFCPLEWWNGNAAICPNLLKVARRYLCVLSCAIPLQRIPHTQQTIFHQARNNLSRELVDILLFLNANYSS